MFTQQGGVAIYVIARTTSEDIDRRYAQHLQQLPTEIDKEIDATLGEATPTSLDYLTHKKNAIVLLTAMKNEEKQNSIRISNLFYGSSPLDKNPVDFTNAFQTKKHSVVGNADDVFKAWIASYAAARGVAILIESIRILNEKSAVLDAEIAVAQAVEQASLAAQAEADAHRLEEEQSRLAAEEKKAAEESSGLEADSAFTRTANTYQIKGSTAIVQPLFVSASGAIAVAETAVLTLQAAIRAAIAGLTAAVASVASGLFVGVSALVYSPKLANGELPESYSFSIPVSDIAPDNKEDLHAIAAAEGTIELPFRLSSKANAQGGSELIVINTTASGLSSSIKVVAATHNPEHNTYSVTTSDNPSTTLIWTPAETPQSSPTTLPLENPAPSVFSGTSVTPIEGRIDIFPQAGETSFRDIITVFPRDSGLPPIYVMFRDRREDPGVVTGNGEPISDNWLSGASVGDGAAIPSHIADQMRGQKFTNFKEFRETFWRLVGSDPELASQFTNQNKAHLFKGRAPFVRRLDSAGARTKFELHHRVRLSDGGPVFDIDNLRIATPRLHISIHQKGKDYDQ